MRPPLPRELTGYRPYENAVLVDPTQRVVTLSENLQSLSSNGVVDGLVRCLVFFFSCSVCVADHNLLFRLN